MQASEKLERALQDEWELHGDPKQLCMILREELLKRSLTAEEKSILELSVALWNEYVNLPPSPSDPTCREVQNAIHAIQSIIGARVASRCDPRMWLQG